MYLRTHDIVRTNRIYEDEEVSQAVRLSTVRLSLSSVGAGLSLVGVRTDSFCEDQKVSQAVLRRCEPVLRGFEEEQNV